VCNSLCPDNVDFSSLVKFKCSINYLSLSEYNSNLNDYIFGNVFMAALSAVS